MAKKIKYSPGIRQKITFGYYAIVAIILGLSVFTFMDLRFIERKVIYGETIAEFFNTTLEIRRFEKNYFLYNQKSDYEENLFYVAKAQESLKSNAMAFSAIAQPRQTAALLEYLKEYREVIGWYAAERVGPTRTVLEGKIRKIGKGILNISEDLARTERKNLQVQLYNSQLILIFSIFFLSLLAVAIGQVLSKMVGRPLKLLEESMEIIADGRFETIHIDSKDREIVSLAKAFNKMLKELELRQRHLIQSAKLASMGTLLSGVAHELNNPLSNISSSCQILAEEVESNDTDYKKELLSQIDEQIDRARNIIRSLLEFSRDKDFRKEELRLQEVIEETLRFVKGQVPAKVEIALDVPEDIVVYADKQRLQQAFLNLIKNALEAISDEGGIYIKARQLSAAEKTGEDPAEIYNYLKYGGKCFLEEDTVDIEIRDTGSGIPNELLSKVFDPFFSTKHAGQGYGLGLSIVHEIIEEHDGCIAVHSQEGSGTTFIIRLPVPKQRGVSNNAE